VIDLGALVFVVLFLVILGAMRWPTTSKVAAACSYLLGVAAPVALHCALTIPITGDVRPGFLKDHAETKRALAHAVDPDEAPSGLTIAARNFADGVLGPHGLLSHFPVLLFGVGGISAVLHRHWPAATKAFAVVTLGGAVAVVGVYVVLDPDWTQPMFATRWFIVFVPLLVFWAGAWLRRNHHPVVWTGAAVMLSFSTRVHGRLGRPHADRRRRRRRHAGPERPDDRRRTADAGGVTGAAATCFRFPDDAIIPA
jgi:hypothetical protein